MLLQIENLSKTYRLKDRDNVALKNVSFTTRPGEILGVVERAGEARAPDEDPARYGELRFWQDRHGRNHHNAGLR